MPEIRPELQRWSRDLALLDAGYRGVLRPYRPLRAVLLWHLLVALVTVFLVVDVPALISGRGSAQAPTADAALVDAEAADAQVAKPEFEAAAAPDSHISEAAVAQQGWLAAFLQRSMQSPLCLFMFGSFIALFGYGTLQLPAIALDAARAWSGSSENCSPEHRQFDSALARAGLATFAVLSGRAPGFYAGPPPATHFHSGLEILLQPVRQGTPLFPAVGFMGTVVGISIAIQALPSVMGSDNLSVLLDGLYLAFDTTLLGLVALAFLTILQILVDTQRLTTLERLGAAATEVEPAPGLANGR